MLRTRIVFNTPLCCVTRFFVVLDPDVSLMGPELPYIEPSRGAFDVLKQSLSKMAASNDQEGRRVVALLRFLTKHEILRENVLTDDVLDTLMTLFDTMINLTGRNFIQAMDGLTCLLQCGVLVVIAHLDTR